MKKIMNKPETMVLEMCQGMVLAHPELAFQKKYKIIHKKQQNKNKVSLISGGGSGHEPAHAGFIGKGMLDAAVCGDIFASPSQIQVYQAIRETASEKGTLLIIKNYSGDMMNFKNAANLAMDDGITVDYVKVDDDIAVSDSLYTVGRRGVAGTVFVHKIAGAAAELLWDLPEVKRVALKAIANVKSIGFAFSSCTVPAKGTPTFILGEDEMEYGVGIHGEPGIQREKISSADELAKRMVTSLLKELEVNESEEVAVLVNGFGGSPLQELYLLNQAVMRELYERNVHVVKNLVGNYMTSIDMAGGSVSILKMDDELKQLLAEEADTPALKTKGIEEAEITKDSFLIPKEENEETQINVIPESFGIITNNKITLENIIFIIDKMSESIIEHEIPFCELDAHAGDGDFGMSIAKGFKQLKKEWNEIIKNHSEDIGSFLEACSFVIMEYCGGASGPIWGSAFRAAGKATAHKKFLTTSEFADMLEASVKGIQLTGERSFGRGAVVGDKTLIDALVPCAQIWSSESKREMDVLTLFKVGAKAAVQGAENTKEIVARMGRAGTVGERSLGFPDAGAYGLGVIFTEISESLKS